MFAVGHNSADIGDNEVPDSHPHRYSIPWMTSLSSLGVAVTALAITALAVTALAVTTLAVTTVISSVVMPYMAIVPRDNPYSHG